MNVNLDRHDVISVDGGKTLLGAKTFTVSEIAKYLGDKYIESRQEWFNDKGVECYVLQELKGWTKGRARITVEFIPDEDEVEAKELDQPQKALPPSPLDDLRQQVNGLNQ